MIILSAFFFACMNVSVRLAGDLPSVQKSFFRNLVAAVFAAIILTRKHMVPRVQKQYWGPLFLRCAFGTLGILCNFYAIDHLLVADASILNKLSPFFAIIFSFLLLKEKITPTQGACVFLAFIGCLFVVKPGFQNAALVPALIGVCGGLGAGVAYTMVRVLGTHGVKGPIIVFYFSVFSCLFVLPYLIFDYTPMTGRQLVTLMMAGLFAAGGQFTITAAYTYAPQVRFTFWIAIATGFAMLVILAWLTIVAGRSNREEGIVLNRVDKMKTEIFILLSVAVMVICIYGEISLSYSLLNGVWFSEIGRAHV